MTDDRTDDDDKRKIPGGYVLLARSLRDSDVWGWDSDHIRLFVYLLMEARWDPRPHQIGDIMIARGQVLKSYRRISEENEFTDNRQVRRWSTSRVKRMVDRLEAAGMIRVKATELGTLFTVRNFNVYQDPERYKMELGTGSEQVRNNRKKEKKEKNPTAPDDSVDFSLTREVERLAELAGKHLQLDGVPTDKDRDIIGMWLRRGRTPEVIERVIQGLRLAIEQGVVPFIPPGTPAGCAALEGTEWDGRAVWGIAEDHGFRGAAPRKPGNGREPDPLRARLR